jgi:hypothetical protein
LKLVHIHYHFEFSEAIEAILDRQKIRNFVRYSMVDGKDRDGKHYGSKVYPGSSSVVQALVPDRSLTPLMEDLKEFKEAEDSHRHLTAAVLAVETLLE